MWPSRGDRQPLQLLGLPAQQLVGHPLERLADHHEAVGTASAEVQVAEPADAPTVAPLGGQHDQIERVHRLDLAPPGASAAGLVRRLDRLHHHAFVAGGDRVGGERFGLRRHRR